MDTQQAMNQEYITVTKNFNNKFKYIVGIDEVGRGPLAGPLAVGVCVFLKKNSHSFFSGVKDSKKLSPIKRKIWFEKMKLEKNNGRIDFAVSFCSHSMIDKHGLTKSVKKAITTCLKKLNLPPAVSMVYLDGGLRAPQQYINQLTIIKADEKIAVVALASIAAKVLRDKKMDRFAKKILNYGFESNKGYGTKYHRMQLKKLGPTPIHRLSFLKNFNI